MLLHLSIEGSFLFLSSFLWYGWIYHSLFFYLQIDGNLGYFQFGNIMNTAAINISVQVLVWSRFYFSWVNIQEWGYWMVF